MAPQAGQEKSTTATIAMVVALGAFMLAALGIVVATTTDGSGSKASAATTTLSVTLSEFAITPAALTAQPGAVTITVTNTGTQVHDFSVGGAINQKTPEIAPGKSATLKITDAPAGTYPVTCTIPGHTDAGMKATLTVGSGGGAAAAATGATGSAAQAPTGAAIDFSATPAEPFTPRDPKAPPPLSGTVHDITIETNETEIEVAPGVTQQMFTFNLAGEKATVPGPVLRGHLGDTFRVTLVNKGKVDHSIDFHASKVAWDKKMKSIHPGESLVYEFTANYAGAFMYHCGTAPALHHIGNGMYGAIIIDPPVLAPVDHEYVLVQSEIYTGPNGQPGDLSKMTHEAWDAVVFNGYVNQYKVKPIRVETNERVRVWVVDDGPSENSAFHIVGTVFDTVFKEGTYVLQPDVRQGGSQVLDLQPAEGGFVEFSFAEDGLYPIVTHKFANVGKGALGLFQSGEVTPAPAAGH